MLVSFGGRGGGCYSLEEVWAHFLQTVDVGPTHSVVLHMLGDTYMCSCMLDVLHVVSGIHPQK